MNSSRTGFYIYWGRALSLSLSLPLYLSLSPSLSPSLEGGGGAGEKTIVLEEAREAVVGKMTTFYLRPLSLPSTCAKIEVECKIYQQTIFWVKVWK